MRYVYKHLIDALGSLVTEAVMPVRSGSPRLESRSSRVGPVCFLRPDSFLHLLSLW